MSHNRKGMKISSVTSSAGHLANSLTDYSNKLLPPVNIAAELLDGMTVSAMSLPLQRTVTTARKSQDFKSGGRAVHVKEAISTIPSVSQKPLLIAENGRSEMVAEIQMAEECKTIKYVATNKKELDDASKKIDEAMAVEKTLRKRILSLEKTTEHLHGDVNNRDGIINELRNELTSAITLEVKYKELYEAEKVGHERTRRELSTACATVAEKERTLTLMRQQHEKEIYDLRSQTDKMLADLRDVKDKEIESRDEKIKKMKVQMAEAFAGNSWERQQQLDSLTKELSKLQDEADALRQRLKVHDKAMGSSACENCQQMAARLERKDKSLKDKDRNLDEITTLCTALRKQLKEKDEQLKHWSSMQGRVLVFPK